MPQYQGVWTLEAQAQALTNQQWVTDPNFKNTTLLLQADGTGSGSQNQTFLDSSTNNFFITRNGNTTQGSFSPFSQAPGYWSNYFDGSSYLSCGSSAFVFPANFTVECWFYALTLPSNKAIFSSGNSVASGLDWGVNSSGQLYVYSNTFLGTSTSALTANTWNHIALVRNGSGSSNCVFYINGVSAGSFTNTTSFTSTLNNIAGNGFDSTARPNAYISNFRSVIGTALYTSNFTPPTTPLTAISGTSLLICQSNRFVDNSTNNFAITVTAGTPSVQAFGPFAPALQWTPTVVGGSGYFGAATDYLTWTGTAVGSGAFTVEFWFYNTADFSVNRSPIGVLNTSGYNSALDVRIANSTTINVSQYNVANNNFTVPTMYPNTWYHVAITRNSSNSTTVFLNGVRSSTGAVTIATNFSGLTSSIARIDQTNTGAWIGYLSSIRIVTGSNIYDPTQTTITIPTVPLTAVSGTQFLMSATNAGIYDGKMGNALQTVGNAQVSTSPVKYGSGSMYFNGSTDYLKPYYPAPANGTTFSFGTGDFTIEFWMYPTSLPSAGMLMDGRGSGASGDMWLINFVSGVANWYVGGNLITSSTISANTWTHLAVCKANGSTRMFLNGIQTGSTYADTKNYTVGNGWPTIGASYNAVDFFAGYMDDIRITKSARYIANFTPPQQALPRQ